MSELVFGIDEGSHELVKVPGKNDEMCFWTLMREDEIGVVT